MPTIFAIFIGGGFGSITRYGFSRLITSNFQHINPVATLASNVISTIVLALLVYFFTVRYNISDSVKAMLITGFCGGFSTFSTFSYESFELLRSGHLVLGIANVLISALLGLLVLLIIAQRF